jgi:hypothetical protein
MISDEITAVTVVCSLVSIRGNSEHFALYSTVREMSYGNRITVRVGSDEHIGEIESMLRWNGFDIERWTVPDRSDYRRGYVLTLHIDAGIGGGLWEVIDLLMEFLGVGLSCANLCGDNRTIRIEQPAYSLINPSPVTRLCECRFISRCP